MYRREATAIEPRQPVPVRLRDHVQGPTGFFREAIGGHRIEAIAGVVRDEAIAREPSDALRVSAEPQVAGAILDARRRRTLDAELCRRPDLERSPVPTLQMRRRADPDRAGGILEDVPAWRAIGDEVRDRGDLPQRFRRRRERQRRDEQVQTDMADPQLAIAREQHAKHAIVIFIPGTDAPVLERTIARAMDEPAERAEPHRSISRIGGDRDHAMWNGHDNRACTIE